jgi:hypothetical protein
MKAKKQIHVKNKENKFFSDIASIIDSSRRMVGRTVNLLMCITYFEIGRLIITEEQCGADRARYGEHTLSELSVYLTKRYGSGFSLSILKNMRQFYIAYEQTVAEALSSEVAIVKSHALDVQFEKDQSRKGLHPSMIDKYPFKLSWSHYLILMKIKNILELGKGFLFEARQKRFTFDEDHFMVDLVFYNRLLQCYVLIDLKTEKIKHQDLGQMMMYVNYFDRYVKTDKETPTIGILLCQKKNDNVVKLTLPENSNIFATEYSLYLPDKSLLQSKLAEWVQEFEERHTDE